MSPQPRILIIDDTPDNVSLLSTIFRRAGYKQIRGHTEPQRALEAVREFRPDLIVLDLMMPDMNGLDVLRALPGVCADRFLPVLVVTSNTETEMRQAALSLGATDFIARPHQPFDVILRARNLLQTRALHLELQARNLALEAEVLARTLHLEEVQNELKAAQLDVIERLALAGEHHDDDTGAHTRRVADSCGRIAQRLALPAEQASGFFTPRRSTMSAKSAFPIRFCSSPES